MRMALEKIAFLPFGKMIDEWRWKVFSGEVTPENYNAAWWALREQYQGVAPPVARTEADFDPGAKYHVPGNMPYTRYFLSFIIQFQFHKALCEAAGFKGPLHECSIYGSEVAGRKFGAMLAKGASLPWQDALFELTGTRQMMPRRSWTISRRCRGGSSSRTRDRSAAGRKTTMTQTTVAPQLTVRAIVLAIILAMILAAANTYLGLFAGLTIASAIPAAVVSMAVLRVLGGGGILENNIVQTGASAGSSIASGVIFTVPALVILGHWADFDYLWVLAIAGLGGILGVFFSVPLRRALIVDQGLAFPEGKAAAEVLKTGENPAPA